ncbi:MAG: isochorismatase family protein [Cyanobacteria bacterium SZAS TMP-1]|nr:isochorismatase family protein [Cyanobacteria bacterium SZAS TMP-1]
MNNNATEPPVLVIMDMQPGFPAAQDALTIYAVAEQIRQAREHNLGIIVVEYDPHECGSTLPQIMEHLRGYDRAHVISKGTDDGSAEIFDATIENGLWPESYIICGVNSDACILKTVAGLVARVPSTRITLVQDACNAENGKDCAVWHDTYPRMPHVVLQLHAQTQ